MSKRLRIALALTMAMSVGFAVPQYPPSSGVAADAEKIPLAATLVPFSIKLLNGREVLTMAISFATFLELNFSSALYQYLIVNDRGISVAQGQGNLLLGVLGMLTAPTLPDGFYQMRSVVGVLNAANLGETSAADFSWRIDQGRITPLSDLDWALQSQAFEGTQTSTVAP